MSAFAAFVKNPADVFFESQEKDEQIIYLLRRHFVTNAKWIIASVIMFVGPLIVVSLLSSNNISTSSFVPLKYQLVGILIWYLITWMFILESFLDWYFNVYIVTDKRIVDIDFWGLLYKNISETPYFNVQDVTYRTGGIIQTLFNYGDVYIQTAAEKREFEFESVPNPAEVYDKITDLVAEAGGGLRKNK